MLPASPQNPERLATWAEIASYLGVSERTARTYHQKFRLPVHRLPGPRARVWAIPSELDEWMKSFDPKAITNEDEAVENSGEDFVAEPGDAEQRPSGIPIPTPKEQPGQPPAAMRKSLPWAGLWAGAVILVAILLAVALAWPNLNPHHLRLDGQTLVALSETEKEVWRFPLEHPIVENASLPEHGWLVADIDNDGRNETLFYLLTPDDDSVLYCLSPRGKVLWTRSAARPLQNHGGKPPARTQYIGNILGILKPPRADGATIITGAHSLAGYGQQVAALRPDGSLTAAYWHAGWFSRLRIADLDGDGKQEILLGGVNNSFLNQTGPWDDVRTGVSGGTLVVLDRDFPSSQGRTREKDGAWTYDDLPQGIERDVVVFNSPIRVPDEDYFRVIEILVAPNDVQVINDCSLGVMHYTLDKRLNFQTALASSGTMVNALLETVKPRPRNSNELAPAIDRIAKQKMWRLAPDEGAWIRSTAKGS